MIGIIYSGSKSFEYWCLEYVRNIVLDPRVVWYIEASFWIKSKLGTFCVTFRSCLGWNQCKKEEDQYQSQNIEHFLSYSKLTDNIEAHWAGYEYYC